MRQREFVPEEDVFGDAFAQVVVLMVKNWFPERVLIFGEFVDADSDLVGDIFLHVNDADFLDR